MFFSSVLVQEEQHRWESAAHSVATNFDSQDLIYLGKRKSLIIISGVCFSTAPQTRGERIHLRLIIYGGAVQRSDPT